MRGELFLQRLERILDQVLAVQVPYGGVFLFSEEELHFFQRNQPQAIAPPRGDVCTALLTAGRRDFLQLGPGQADSARQGRDQLLLANRLQQVTYRVRIECIDGVFVESGGEDDRRRLRQRIQVSRHLDAIHPRHSHVQQYNIGRQLVSPRQ